MPENSMFKIHSFLFLFAFYTGSWLSAQSEFKSTSSIDSSIIAIQRKCLSIQARHNLFDTIRVDFADQATEGGFAVGYSEKGTLRLIEVWLFFETAKLNMLYFFDKDALIFVQAVNQNYNRPIYWDEKKAKEMDESEVFDPAKTKIEEEIYFFQMGYIIQGINTKGEVIQFKKSADIMLSETYQQEADAYRQKLHL